MEKIPGSYKDPSGFVYLENGTLFRKINPVYQDEYRQLMKSGLYSSLVQENLLIPHQEISPNVIKPEKISFISYPYEWCFSQLKDAALTTLAIQKQAMKFGMTLKDATAYNVQFRNGKPIFIDTLSFMNYQDGEAWLPYRQFCQHFLAPLMLMSYTDIRCQQLLRIYLDGLPLDLARKLLASRAYRNMSFWLHIFSVDIGHRHPTKMQKIRTSRTALTGLLDSLERAIKKLHWEPRGNWADYVPAQEEEYLEFKKSSIKEFLLSIKPQTIWDLGANTGLFSEYCSDFCQNVISLDSDPACIEKLYLRSKERGVSRVMPLIIDLTNPSGPLGWANGERMSLGERCQKDTVLALALVHHLALTFNIPLSMIAGYFRSICTNLIIEFVPKEDPQAQKLLSTRTDVFSDYNQQNFEVEFMKHFEIMSYKEVPDSARKLYLMRGKN